MKKPKFKESVITIVDKNDKVVGTATYHGMKKCYLWHRLSSILVFNSKGQILFQKRAPWLHTKPNQWETRIGGHVDAKETYRQAALRELQEEMGIKIPTSKLKFITKIKINSNKDKFFRSLYTCIYDGKVKIDPDEVTAYKWVDLDKVKTFTKEKISINGLKAINTYKQWQKKKHNN
ncbi:NUDIX domain-containing protein [Patescibacteria group bacterium]|nr:NUDIX domain-containing protein [Patescibacteria group bacterium]